MVRPFQHCQCVPSSTSCLCVHARAARSGAVQLLLESLLLLLQFNSRARMRCCARACPLPLPCNLTCCPACDLTQLQVPQYSTACGPRGDLHKVVAAAAVQARGPSRPTQRLLWWLGAAAAHTHQQTRSGPGCGDGLRGEAGKWRRRWRGVARGRRRVGGGAGSSGFFPRTQSARCSFQRGQHHLHADSPRFQPTHDCSQQPPHASSSWPLRRTRAARTEAQQSRAHACFSSPCQRRVDGASS